MESPAPKDRRDLWCLALLIVIATVFFSDVLFAGSNLFYRDLFRYHFPMKRIVRDAMGSGEFPFWNWSYSNGQPMAANPAYELFYPPQWLILIGSYPFGFALHIVFHVYAALIGMYLLLREMSLGRAAATFGAISFGMGGLLLGTSTMLPTFFVWALAPIVAWGVLRVLREPSAGRFAVAALLAGMQLVIGEPMAIAQVWLLLVTGALALNRRRAIPVMATVLALAILVAAVQLIPAIDHVRNSARSRGMSWQDAKDFSMPPERPIELLIPHFYGSFTPFVSGFWGVKSFDRGMPYLFSIYNGIAVGILVLAGLASRARGVWTVALISIASYLLAIGDRTPLLHALYSLGIARGIRYPEKFAAMSIVAMTIFAAGVADRLLAGDDRTRRVAVGASAMVVAICTIPAAWSLTAGFPGSFPSHWHLPAHAAALAPLARTLWWTGLGLAAGAAALVYLLPKMQRRLWLLLALALILFDLVPLGNELTPRMPAPFFTPPDVVAGFDGDRAAYALVNRGAWLSRDALPHQLRPLLGPWYDRNSLEPFTPGAWGLHTALELDFDETALLPTHDLLDAMMKLGNARFPRWAESFGAISNVRYIVDLLPFEAVINQGEALGNVRVVGVTRVASTGRYYFPQDIVHARTADEVLAFMRANVIRRPTAFVPFPSPATASGRVVAVREGSNHASIDVLASAPALLVITITRHKFWRATIDGREVPLLPVNIAYQGVIVPAGSHRLFLRYSNPIVIWSGFVSGAAIIACIAAMAIAPTRPRRRPRTAP